MDFFESKNNGGFGGKINLSILPNGIKNEKGKDCARFSLLIGLNIDENAAISSLKKFNGDAFKYIEHFGDILNKNCSNLSLNIKKPPQFLSQVINYLQNSTTEDGSDY
nr:hypothetical protein [Bacteroidota bacterium]